MRFKDYRIIDLSDWSFYINYLYIIKIEYNVFGK